MNKVLSFATLVVFLPASLEIVGAESSGGSRDLFDAKKDIAASDLKYFIVGQPMAHDEYFAAILRDSYDLKAVFLGCAPESEEAKDAAAYNSEIVSHLQKKHGKDFIAKAEEEAKSRFKERKKP